MSVEHMLVLVKNLKNGSSEEKYNQWQVWESHLIPTAYVDNMFTTVRSYTANAEKRREIEDNVINLALVPLQHSMSNSFEKFGTIIHRTAPHCIDDEIIHLTKDQFVDALNELFRTNMPADGSTMWADELAPHQNLIINTEEYDVFSLFV